MDFDLHVDNPGGFLGKTLVSGGHSTAYTNPRFEFTLTAAETNTYYFTATDIFPGATPELFYSFSVTEVDPTAPDPNLLPTLTAPNANSLEAALYTGLRVDSRDITYWSAPDGEDGSNGWDFTEKSAALTAMQKWAKVANINFDQADTKAEAKWLLVTQNDFSELGAMHFPEGVQQIGTFNKTDATWGHTGTSTGLSQGGNGFLTLVHEFGHGLGLDHPHDGTKSTKLPGVTSALGDLGDNNLNQTIYTAMSYDTGFDNPRSGVSDAVNWGYVMGPSAIDIAVVQRLYGVRAANTGDTTYDLVSANTTGTGYATIRDTGGHRHDQRRGQHTGVHRPARRDAA